MNPLEKISHFKALLQKNKAQSAKDFSPDCDITSLVQRNARDIDELLKQAWQQEFRSHNIALIAVGGYGRAELHPGSDIDLLILLDDSDQGDHNSGIESFLTLLWDIGLHIGHSVRTVTECYSESLNDITVTTNLMEARFLAGSIDLFKAMKEATGTDKVWSGASFFQAKFNEQKERHHKYHDTSYNLEPNIKEGPGGLRDIQMIGWVAKRHFGVKTLDELVDHNFLTVSECTTLKQGQALLWKIRFALHLMTGRQEDRLLFDYQQSLAKQFGFADSDTNLAVEQFMQQYYRTIMELNLLNEMLLQLFSENILYPNDQTPPTQINPRFLNHYGYLTVSNPDLFKNNPASLLEIFLILEQHPELIGIRAETIRLIRSHRHLINEQFRNEPKHRTLFIEILRQPNGVTHSLRRMNRYRILSAYIPAFAQILGRMQYDLFHAYTVDEHTLFVIRNIRRLMLDEYKEEFPLAHQIINNLDKTELIYIAALFHDIAKGRGGDHSELGSVEVEKFCTDHGYDIYDTHLVSWLVKNHLLMSTTSQRKDISDPETIREFCEHIGDPTRLDHLYLLTHADIRATNPELWNSWKASLLNDLYYAAKRALSIGLDSTLYSKELIDEIQLNSRIKLVQAGLAEARIDQIWQQLDDDYFLRHNCDEICWHTQELSAHTNHDQPLISIRPGTIRGTTAIFVYSGLEDGIFIKTTSVFDRLGLTIMDARIISLHQRALNTYLVLEEDGSPIQSREKNEGEMRIAEIQQALSGALEHPNEHLTLTHKLPRKLRHFETQTNIRFITDESHNKTVMELFTADRPGLLSQVGDIFEKSAIDLEKARISTIGERAEDIFFITSKQTQSPLSNLEQNNLEQALKKSLDELLH